MPRKGTRRPVVGEVTLIFGKSGRLVCKISDLSPGGAKLEVPFTQWLPSIFEIEDGWGVRRAAHLAWQGDEHIGVRYIDNPAHKRPPPFGHRGPPPKRRPSAK